MKRPLLVIFGEKKAFRTLETIINCQMIFKSFCKTHFSPIKDTFIQCPLLSVHINILKLNTIHEQILTFIHICPEVWLNHKQGC